MEPLPNGLLDAELEYEMRDSSKPTVCGICGDNHSPRECDILKVTNHIPDNVIPSKARLTLPDSLEIRKLADCTFNIYTKCQIERGTQFGPFQAKKLLTLHPSIEFPLKVFTDGDEDLSEYFLDTSDENECSWMIFVGAASDFKEQNVICYQEGEYLYYGTIRDIEPGEPLRVWYSPYYATKMKKGVLQENSEENIVDTGSIDVETILKSKKNITPRDSWSCKFCGKVEKELSVFAFHLQEHYRTVMSKTCTICNDTFISKQRLNKHLRLVHGNSAKTTVEIVKDAQILIPKSKEKDSKEALSVGGPLLLNDIIPDSLDNSNLLLPQTDMSQFDLSIIDNQNVLLENENLHLNTDNILSENVKGLDHFNFDIKEPETDQLVCDICLKSFVKPRSLILHLEQHTGKFLCHSCRRAFARKENLLRHSCNSFYKMKCPLCKRIFFQQKSLTQHLKVFHEKKFTCDKCHKYYDSQRRLDRHNCPEAPPTKLEKFACNLCPKIFFKKWNLEEHIERHKRIKKNKQYICATCNMILSSRQSYSQHAKLHEGRFLSCDLCNKLFKRADSLNVHKKQVHSNEGTEETCDICKKKVKSKKLLKTHMAIHQTDRPYKCPLCEATFKQRTNLNKHTNKHKLFGFKLRSLFQDGVEVYQCPKCNKNMKLKSSLQRHMRAFHPNDELLLETIKPALGRLTGKKVEFLLLDKGKSKHGNVVGESEEDESVMDLKQTIENMDFNTDDINCSENNDINIEIDKILNAGNLDNFLNDSSDRIVENLISIAAKDNHLSSVVGNRQVKEPCLSMPDLMENDQYLDVGNNKSVRYLRFME